MSATILPTVVVERKIATCTACGCGIYAELDLVTEVQPAYIDAAGATIVNTATTQEGAAVVPLCGTREVTP